MTMAVAGQALNGLRITTSTGHRQRSRHSCETQARCRAGTVLPVADVAHVRRRGTRHVHLRRLCCSSAEEGKADRGSDSPSQQQPSVSVSSIDLDKEVSSFAKKTASTFAPRASGKQNPAYKGSVLYSVFEWQAYLSVVVGGLLSFNVLFPSDQPTIARLMGMWSLWMFTVPSLRARDCDPAEKDALNLLFIALPLINVGLPFVWKSFPFIYSADVVALVGVYAWKVWAADGKEA